MRNCLLLFTLLFLFAGICIIQAREQGHIPYNTGALAVDGDFLWVGADDGVVRLNMNDGGNVRFNGSTILRFILPSEGNASLEIRDSSGRLVRTLSEGKMTAGQHALSWDGRDNMGRTVASGVYLPILRAGGKTIAGRSLF